MTNSHPFPALGALLARRTSGLRGKAQDAPLALDMEQNRGLLPKIELFVDTAGGAQRGVAVRPKMNENYSAQVSFCPSVRVARRSARIRKLNLKRGWKKNKYEAIFFLKEIHSFYVYFTLFTLSSQNIVTLNRDINTCFQVLNT